MINTEVLRVATSKLGNRSTHFVCAIRTSIYRGQPETFLQGFFLWNFMQLVQWIHKIAKANSTQVPDLSSNPGWISTRLFSSEFMMFWSKTEESEKVGSCWEYEPMTPGLCSQCSATEVDNWIPPHYMYWAGGKGMPQSHTWFTITHPT